jgi:hypothetical protein
VNLGRVPKVEDEKLRELNYGFQPEAPTETPSLWPGNPRAVSTTFPEIILVDQFR